MKPAARMVLTKRLEMGLSCLHQETALKQHLTGLQAYKDLCLPTQRESFPS